MAFEGLTEKLTSVFSKLRGKGHLTQSDVKEAMREIRLALLEADVSYKVVKDFINTVTERAIGEDVLESLTPAQMVIKRADLSDGRRGSPPEHLPKAPHRYHDGGPPGRRQNYQCR